MIKFLSERSLAFRGTDEILGSLHNRNYLSVLELIAKYDPFLADHISPFGNRGKWNPSYLTSTICDELIMIMGKKVLSTICKEIQIEKYFSICVDSTHDVSWTDQLSFTIWYVSPSDEQVDLFLLFLPISSHTGGSVCDHVLDTENTEHWYSELPGTILRQHSKYVWQISRSQKKKKQGHKWTDWYHTLCCTFTWLEHSVCCCLEAINFFGLLNKFYTFSARSTHRWAVLTKGFTPYENKNFDIKDC